MAGSEIHTDSLTASGPQAAHAILDLLESFADAAGLAGDGGDGGGRSCPGARRTEKRSRRRSTTRGGGGGTAGLPGRGRSVSGCPVWFDDEEDDELTIWSFLL